MEYKEIIIKIPKEDYLTYSKLSEKEINELSYYEKIIANGAPLPKEKDTKSCPLVEIVTCKDCKHNGTMRCKCILCDGHQYMSYNHPNFYCADAESKK